MTLNFTLLLLLLPTLLPLLLLLLLTLCRWEPCSDVLHYTYTAGSMIPVHRELVSAGLRALVYSGTADYIVPFTGSRTWVYGLGLKASKPWHSWSMPGSKQVRDVCPNGPHCVFLHSFFVAMWVCGVPFTGSRTWVYGLGMKQSEPWHSWSMPGSKQAREYCLNVPYLCGFGHFFGGGGCLAAYSGLHHAFHWQQGARVWAEFQEWGSSTLAVRLLNDMHHTW
jgi:hypothetical protein